MYIQNEEYGLRLDQQIQGVKGLFVEEKRDLAKLELVDSIQKLGLASHFQRETKEVLDNILTTQSSNSSVKENIYLSSLCFKLLRQHGYKVSTDTLSNFLVKNGKVLKKTLEGSVKDILEILECSHLAVEGENVLEKAKTLALSSLNCASERMCGDLLEEVVHAVELPSHWRVQWFDIKWYINHYQKQHHMDATLLNLAKLNFNIVQAKHQDEVKELSRWDAKEVQQLPEYMRICFQALNDITNETASEIEREKNLDLVLPHLKKVAERERGDAASSIMCYMKEMSVSEEETRNHIKCMIRNAWKKINEECFTDMGSSRQFVSLAANAARVAHTLYQNGDGFGIQDRGLTSPLLWVDNKEQK
ncbi:hypothetical protein L6164_016772 [Bauhinia variegata]|uniref:Uncharacterized protein n=1 Tax=Bauhinia variegata TaxID=167791 RepID=A0ACB9N7D1_BAUVA|nr:hypothetical protein L6164_016772 [Bauhinia variegata]